MSFWPVLCIAVVAVEVTDTLSKREVDFWDFFYIRPSGCIGFAINTLALIYLFDGRLQTKATYKLAMVVSTMQFIGLSAISGFATMCHLFHNQTMFLVYFGLLPLLPQIASDVVLVTLVLLVFGIWEMAPAPCILQYLALCKPHFSTPKRLLMAYSVCLVLVVWTTASFSSEFSPENARSFSITVPCSSLTLNTSRSVLKLLGMFSTCQRMRVSSLRFEDQHSVMPIALFGVLPSYTIGYLIFGICGFKIYRALNVYKMDTKSLKTQQLQKRFFKTLLLQGLLPLLVLSLPVGVFFAGVVSGFDMDLISLSLTFSIWSVPTVQGLVSLSFLRKLKPPSTVQSLSSRNTDSRAH